MELVIYVFFTILSFCLSILTIKDRLFGIGGIMLNFLTMSLAGNDGTITVQGQWSEIQQAYVTRTIPVDPIIIMGSFVLLVLEIVILLSAWGLFKNEEPYAPEV